MSEWVYGLDGRLLSHSDDATRKVYDGTGAVVRAYTAEENAAADARALTAQQDVNEETIGDKIATVDLPAMAAILAQTNADLRADPSQELKDIARAVRRLDRKIMRILDGVD